MITKVGLNTGFVETEFKSSNDKTAKVLDKELIGFVSNHVSEKVNEKSNEQAKPVVASYKALWVIDEKNNVYIRIEDEKGNVVRQIPPEEVVNLREKLKELSKKIFDIEA